MGIPTDAVENAIRHYVEKGELEICSTSPFELRLKSFGRSIDSGRNIAPFSRPAGPEKIPKGARGGREAIKRICSILNNFGFCSEVHENYIYAYTTVFSHINLPIKLFIAVADGNSDLGEISRSRCFSGG